MARSAAGGLAGLALAAPAWVSFLDYLRIASVGIHLLVTGNHLALDQAPALLMPTIYGPPFAEWAPAAWSDDGGYFGAALGMLALLGMLSGPRWRAIRAAMAGWIAVWLGVFLGAPVVHTVWAALPPLNAVQVTRYAMPSLECAAAVLAALAVSNWRAAVPGARAAWAGVAFAVLAGAALVLGLARRPTVFRNGRAAAVPPGCGGGGGGGGGNVGPVAERTGNAAPAEAASAAGRGRCGSRFRGA